MYSCCHGCDYWVYDDNSHSYVRDCGTGSCPKSEKEKQQINENEDHNVDDISEEKGFLVSLVNG